MKRKTLLFCAIISLFSIVSGYSQGFTDVSAAAGILFEHDGVPFEDDMPFGSGAAWFDYNSDGLLDLYLTNRNTANKLYRNDGGGTFTNVAAAMGVEDASGDGGGVVIGDINNDGLPDIFLANGNEDKLYRNEGGGNAFVDITNSSGLGGTFDSRGTSGSFGDYNKDGFLDLFITHHIPIAGSSGNATNQGFLFLNDGDETFTDVSNLLGIAILSADAAFIAGWTDIDHDNDLDIILINDCGISIYSDYGTRVFRNDGGTDPINDWTFTEISNVVLQDCSNGMGIGIGDYNRDGWMDIVYTDIGPIQLYKNNAGSFDDVSSSAEIGTQDLSSYSWGTSFLDYNNDMWQDIVVALGGFWPDNYNDHENNLFENNGDGTFTDVANAMGIDDGRKTRNIVHADYDNDGDLDLFMVNYDSICTLYRNDVINSNNYFRVQLVGTIGNRDGIGAKIKITTPDNVDQYFEMKSGTNLGGGDEMIAHFGIGTNTSISAVEVTWLSGAVSNLNNLSSNSTAVIAEPAVVPVELTSFYAERKNQSVSLHWTTASESNNDFFEIQRSPNGTDFVRIGKVAGKGNSSVPLDYSFLDEHPQPGNNYYRIKQVDFDGYSAYTKIVSVFFGSAASSIKIYPNPVAGNSIFFEFPELPEENTVIEIFDIAGKLILRKNINGFSGDYLNLEVPIHSISNGIFLAKITSRTIIRTQKVIINR